MSHLKQRKENNCLNCNARVFGKYCHICGQENIEPKESAWHLVNHFFQDITHFDGKFFSTLGLLIRRPGFLSAEYSRGRRASYLNPIRMYIFTSAIFFLVFFTFYKADPENMTARSTINGKTLAQVEAMDSAVFADFTKRINKSDGKAAVPMSRAEFKHYYENVINESLDSAGLKVHLTTLNYHSKEAYDSALRSGKERGSWLEKKLTYKQIELDEKFRGNGREMLRAISETFLHKLPQLLFISLPLLALLLKLLYVRRKEFYYVSHGIFSIHLYIFIFIALLFYLGLGKLYESLHWGIIDTAKGLVVLGILFYEYKAMRNFYHQRRFKTIFKFILLNLLFFIILAVLFAGFLLFSLLSI